MLFAFVPMLLLRHGADRAALFARAGRVFTYPFFGTALATALFAPWWIAVLGPGLAAPERAEAVVLLRWLAPSTLFAAGASTFAALLYTERRFVVPGIYQTCLNVATIAGALVLRKSMGVYGFAIGYTTGSALQLALTWFFTRSLRSAPRSNLHVPLAEFLLKPGLFLLYAGLIASNVVVTRIFATHAGPGMAAAFDYCMRCMSVVLAYLVYPVASTLVPEIARLRGTDETSRAYSLIDKGVLLMAVAAVASCALGILLRTPVIALLFQRGNFTPESTRLVSGGLSGLRPQSARLGAARPDRALLLRAGSPETARDCRVHSDCGESAGSVDSARGRQSGEPRHAGAGRFNGAVRRFRGPVYDDSPAASNRKRGQTQFCGGASLTTRRRPSPFACAPVGRTGRSGKTADPRRGTISSPTTPPSGIALQTWAGSTHRFRNKTSG